MGTVHAAISDAFASHSILAVLAGIVLGVALLLGLLHELALILEVARFLVVRVKDHLGHVGRAAHLLWIEITTWRARDGAVASPTDTPRDG